MAKKKYFSSLFYIYWVVLFITLFSLTACGQKYTLRTYQLVEENGKTITITFRAQGNVVVEQSTKTTIPYSAIGVSTEAEARKILEPLAHHYHDVDGIEELVDYREDAVIELFTIDYEVVDMEELSQLPNIQFTGNTTDSISLSNSIKMLKQMGYKKVE